MVWNYGTQPSVMALTLNQGTTYYLSALAVAIGFKMNLFNIGVEGQYRLAARARRQPPSARRVPAGTRCTCWSSSLSRCWSAPCGPASPACSKATRGVNEVISTIMLNAIAIGVTALAARVPSSANNPPIQWSAVAGHQDEAAARIMAGCPR